MFQKLAVSFLLTLGLIFPTLASEQDELLESKKGLLSVVRTANLDTLRALNGHLKRLDETQLLKLPLLSINSAGIKLETHIPDSITAFVMADFPSKDELYRNMIVFFSLAKPELSKEGPGKNGLNTLCALYFTMGTMDQEMTTAFGSVENNYNINIIRKSLNDRIGELTISQKLTTLPLFASLYGANKMIHQPHVSHLAVPAFMGCLYLYFKT